MRLSAHIKEGWALYARPIELLIFVLAQWQKEGFSHQLHSEPEAVGKGIAFDDAVHLVHTVLELFKRFLLLVCKRFSQLLAVPGDQLQQLLQTLISTGALLKGGNNHYDFCFSYDISPLLKDRAYRLHKRQAL